MSENTSDKEKINEVTKQARDMIHAQGGKCVVISMGEDSYSISTACSTLDVARSITSLITQYPEAFLIALPAILQKLRQVREDFEKQGTEEQQSNQKPCISPNTNKAQ